MLLRPLLSTSLLFILLLLSAACGKIGDPLPPIPRAPLAINELTAVQRGTRIVVSFPFTRPARSRRFSRIEIFRLIESESDPAGMTPESFSARATLIAAIPAEQVPVGSRTVEFDDPIPTSNTGARYRYAARIVDPDGRAADLSNYAVITPLAELAKAPTDLQTRVTQNEIVISWKPPAGNESGTTPANVAGYNLYRRAGETTARLNAQPLTDPRYSDREFEFGKQYEYFVRSLSLAPGMSNLAEAIEGEPSAVHTVIPKDTFPPAPPESIRIASINGVVSLFWPSNAEPDLSGYLIYRSEDEQAPPENWLKLTPRLHTPTTFRDDKVIVGKRYYYRLTAVDIFGNESAPSAVVGETVNP